MEIDASDSNHSRVPILDQDEIQDKNKRSQYQPNSHHSGISLLFKSVGDEENSNGIYNGKPLSCFGCGIGWFSFILGFVFPFLWYFATILYFTKYHLKNPRERQGLAASAIAVKKIQLLIFDIPVKIYINVRCSVLFMIGSTGFDMLSSSVNCISDSFNFEGLINKSKRFSDMNKQKKTRIVIF